MSGGYDGDFDSLDLYAETVDWEDCGLDDDGLCTLAGSEHCDFQCQYRNSNLFAGNRDFRPRRKPK